MSTNRTPVTGRPAFDFTAPETATGRSEQPARPARASTSAAVRQRMATSRSLRQSHGFALIARVQRPQRLDVDGLLDEHHVTVAEHHVAAAGVEAERLVV